MPPRGEVATDETRNLIAADKVVGTAVYNRQGEHLGSVYGLMLNKLNGQVSYAIMSVGGFLGISESYHPLPWRGLTYDPRQDGYVVDLGRNRLENVPSSWALGIEASSVIALRTLKILFGWRGRKSRSAAHGQ